jgi:hypothetical protein
MDVNMLISNLVTIAVAIAILWLVWKVITGVLKFVISIAVVAVVLYLIMGAV